MFMWLIMVPGILSVTSLFWLLMNGGELRSLLACGIVLCVVLFVALLYKPTRWYAAAITVILPLVLIVALRPVCTQVDDITLQAMNPPIHLRTDVDIYMPVFQQRPDGGWNQCKTQLSRWMFF